MMYPSNADNEKRLLTSDAFFRAAAIAPKGACYWIEKLEALTEVDFSRILIKVPDEIITPLAKDFALAMLIQNRRRLLDEFESMATKT